MPNRAGWIAAGVLFAGAAAAAGIAAWCLVLHAFHRAPEVVCGCPSVARYVVLAGTCAAGGLGLALPRRRRKLPATP